MNTGLICIAICPATADQLESQLRRAETLADIIEIRFDCLRPDELDAARKVLRERGTSKPLIGTFRSPAQGGNRDITREERLAFWRSLGESFAYADLEQDIIDAVALKAKIIASRHDFDGIPKDLDQIYQQLAADHPAVVKIAATANDICDAIPLWNLLRQARTDVRQIIPIGMGEAGKWSRILGLAHGAFLTYASLDAGKETAGGQITADDLISVYRAKDLGTDTRVYGVIGDPVSSSLSPFMHNAAFREAELNSVFLPLEVKDLDAFMRRMVLPAIREVDVNFAGFAVTMPHKQAIIKYLDDIDPVAETIGAVNTVKMDDGKLLGYNTDAHGFITPLKQRIPDLKDARAAVLGAGGAARAVVHALKAEGAEISIFARDISKAASFAGEFDLQTSPLSTLHFPLSTDIVVNTTPLGMLGPYENQTPLTSERLSGVKFVYDLVTRRDETPLLREAKKAGADAVGGVEMLIAQGVKQFEIWTGLDAPADVMRQAVLDRLK